MLPLKQFATLLVLAQLLAPPGWCCTFTPCPLQCCRQGETKPAAANKTEAKSLDTKACCKCRTEKASGESAMYEAAACSTVGCKPAAGDTATDESPARIPSPSDCPCRIGVGQIVEKAVLSDPASATACFAPYVTVLVSHETDPRPREAAILRPPVDLQTRLCRWLC